MKPLKEAGDDARYGGKAAGLSRLILAGIRVPPGVAFTWDEDEIQVGDFAVPGPTWAVRSSAVGEDGAKQSMAGQYTTVLNVQPQDVLDAVRQVRQGRGEARMGVVVQQQIEAFRSFVVFTRDPDNQAPGVLIEGVRGPCSRLVNGEVTPSTYRVHEGQIVSQTHGDENLHAESRLILRVAELALRIETVMGCPQDIEMVEGEQPGYLPNLWVVQSRPVTTF